MNIYAKNPVVATIAFAHDEKPGRVREVKKRDDTHEKKVKICAVYYAMGTQVVFSQNERPVGGRRSHRLLHHQEHIIGLIGQWPVAYCLF